jgi:hypothetical protein
MAFAIVVIAVSQAALAQQVQVREQLMARGAPAEFADQVAEIVASAESEALPTDPLVSKALEGWAKRGRVPPDRVITVMNQLHTRLRAGREVTVGAGFDPPPGAVVSAAAGALGRGMSRQDVVDIIDAAPAPEAAATGLTVASALAAQGLERAAAVKVVRDAYRGGRTPEEVLEFPSTVTGLRARGEPMSEVARRILQGGGLPMRYQGTGGQAGRPPGVPPEHAGSSSGGKKKGQTKKP